MMEAIAIRIPQLGVVVPLAVFVPDGPDVERRVGITARVVVAAMVRSAGLWG